MFPAVSLGVSVAVLNQSACLRAVWLLSEERLVLRSGLERFLVSKSYECFSVSFGCSMSLK